MIPHYDQHNNEFGGRIIRSMDFTIKSKNLRHIVKLIRDSIYKDKVLAPLREYATNSLDSHIARDRRTGDGSSTTPIRVTLPTLLDPFLRIRDFGVGLTPEEVEDIYISIGESSKRGNNDETGSMGLGSKSGFAYGDSFIVTAWKNGRHVAYNMLLDDKIESGCRCDVLTDQPCDPTEQGVEVEIPVKQEDIKLFPEKALNLFKYWKVFPELVNIDENRVKEVLEAHNKPSVLSGEGWTIRPKENRWGGGSTVVVMANVPYRIDFDTVAEHIKFEKDQDRIIFNFLKSNDVIFEVENGQADFDVSREGLQYTDRTVAVIYEMVKRIANTIQDIVSNQISGAKNIWEAKIIYGSIFDGSNWSRREDKDSDETEDKTGFSGELDSLREFFKDKIVWNGIKINSSAFVNIHQWDRESGQKSSSYEVHKTVVERFSYQNGRIRGVKCNNRKANEIVPSKKAVVLINDTGKSYGARMTAKYILTSGMFKGVVRVYFMDFANDSVKTDFFKHYNFDSVPMELVSTWIQKAKDASKKDRPAGGNSRTGGGARGPQDVYTLDITEYAGSSYRHGRRGYVNGKIWNVQTIDIKEESGYYVPRSTDRAEVRTVNIETDQKVSIDIDDLSGSLHVLKKELGLSIDRIFGFSQRTLDAKWFGEAKDDGQWTPLAEFLKEIPGYITDEMKTAFAYVEAIHENDGMFHIGRFMAKRLQGRINDLNSPMARLVEAIVNIKNFPAIYQALKRLGFTVEVDKSANFKSLMEEVHQSYPLLWMLDCRSGLQEDNPGLYDRIKKPQLDLIVDHINKEDTLRELSTPVEVNQEDLVTA